MSEYLPQVSKKACVGKKKDYICKWWLLSLHKFTISKVSDCSFQHRSEYQLLVKALKIKAAKRKKKQNCNYAEAMMIKNH